MERKFYVDESIIWLIINGQLTNGIVGHPDESQLNSPACLTIDENSASLDGENLLINFSIEEVIAMEISEESLDYGWKVDEYGNCRQFPQKPRIILTAISA